MEKRKQVLLSINEKVWKDYQKLCRILGRVPSRETEEFMKNELVMFKLVSYLNKISKGERKKKNE